MNSQIIRFEAIKIHPFELTIIQDFKMVQKISKHCELYFEAIVDDAQRDLYVSMTTFDTNIAVEVVGEGTIFQGIITHIEVRAIQGVYHLFVEAVSFSYQMALAKRSRSCQDQDIPIEELVKQIIAPYKGADVIFKAGENILLNRFVLQYDQYDWDFIVMLASMLHTGIIVSPEFAAPKIYFGIPQDIPAVTLTNTNYTLEKRLSKWASSFTNNIPGWNEEISIIAYSVQSNILLKMGQGVVFQGQNLYVESIISHIEKGVLVHEYSLTTDWGLTQERLYNPNIIGASIEGEVIDVSRERVKLHLFIDGSQDKEKACWFEYASMYNSGSHSGIYIMPEIGDYARLHFYGKDERSCVVINSCNRESLFLKELDETKYGLKRDRWSDPSVKSIKANGKELLISKDRIIIHGTDVSVTWHDEDGLTISTRNNINIQADEGITIKGAEVNVDGEEEVKITCGGSSIKLTPGAVKIKGSDIKID